MVGIYKITSPSNKIYIGQSWCIEKRFKSYKSTECKKQIKLNNSFLKYGVNNHNFNIIYELPIDITQEVLDDYEKLFILQYKNSGLELLNLREGGSRGKHSVESKIKMSLNSIGKSKINIIAEKNHKSIYINQLDSEGKLIYVYGSIEEAVRLSKSGYNSIVRSIRGLKTNGSGYNWNKISLDEFNNFDKINNFPGIKINKEYKIKIIAILPSQECLEFESISEAARQLKVFSANILKVLKNTRKTTNNIKFIYSQ